MLPTPMPVLVRKAGPKWRDLERQLGAHAEDVPEVWGLEDQLEYLLEAQGES